MSEEAMFCGKFDVLNPPDDRCKYQPEIVADISPHVDAVPELVDWDRDGDLDLVAGKSDGKIKFFLNIVSEFLSIVVFELSTSKILLSVKILLSPVSAKIINSCDKFPPIGPVSAAIGIAESSILLKVFRYDRKNLL